MNTKRLSLGLKIRWKDGDIGVIESEMSPGQFRVRWHRKGVADGGTHYPYDDIWFFDSLFKGYCTVFEDSPKIDSWVMK